jgi:hypothetical protein
MKPPSANKVRNSQLGRSIVVGVFSVFCLCAFAATARAQNATIMAAPDNQSAKLNCLPVVPVLRSDFTQVGTFDCVPPGKPTDLFRQDGTVASFKYDELSHTTSASIDGLGALAIRVYGDTNGLLGLVAGPFIQGDGTYDFRSATSRSKTLDTLTSGVFAQFGVNDNLFGDDDYFRLRAGAVNGNAGITSNTFVGEWLPVGGSYMIGLPSRIGSLFYVFSPELMVQYDQLDSGPNKYLLFADRKYALRVGPEFVIKLWLDHFDDLTFNLTYHPSVEVYSGRWFSWLQTTLQYNLVKEGYVAISTSFGLGNTETTANRASQFKLGISVKY